MYMLITLRLYRHLFPVIDGVACCGRWCPSYGSAVVALRAIFELMISFTPIPLHPSTTTYPHAMSVKLLVGASHAGFVFFVVCLYVACRAYGRVEQRRLDERLRQGGGDQDIELAAGIPRLAAAQLASDRERRCKSYFLALPRQWQIAPSTGFTTTGLNSTTTISTRHNGTGQETQTGILGLDDWSSTGSHRHRRRRLSVTFDT